MADSKASAPNEVAVGGAGGPAGCEPGGAAIVQPNVIVKQPPIVVQVDGPIISSLSPNEGAVGTQVNINGVNFNNPNNTNVVQTVIFVGSTGPVVAEHMDKSTTLIVAQVPEGAVTGIILVTTGQLTTPPAAAAFFIVDPHVDSFAPNVGPPEQTLVTLNGTALSSVTAVQFNGVSAAIVSQGYDFIVVKVPTLPNIPLPSSVNIRVLVDSAAFLVPGLFMVTRPHPTITGFTPMHGIAAVGMTTPGTEVTINGTHLDLVNLVKFNGTPQKTIDSSTPMSVKARVPMGATTGYIEVDAPSNDSGGVFTATSPSKFTVIVPPVVTSINPTSGKAGVTKVTISGHHLKFVTKIHFTGSAQIIPETADPTPETQTNQQITATVSSDAKTGPITVTDDAGSTMTQVFTVTG